MAYQSQIVARTIRFAFDGAEAEVQRLFVAEAKRQLQSVLTEQRPSSYSQSVDHVPGAALETVLPFGTITFSFTYLVEVVEAALAILRALSPVRSGTYRDAHGIFSADGLRLASPTEIGTTTTIIIANTAPYARRIELPSKWKSGPNKGQPRGWSVQPQVPQPADAVYKHAAVTINRQFGNIARAEYTWASLDGARFPAITLTSL